VLFDIFADYYHQYSKLTAEQIWNRDKEKIKLAENAGYKVKVIWEDDWNNCENKEEHLKLIIQ